MVIIEHHTNITSRKEVLNIINTGTRSYIQEIINKGDREGLVNILEAIEKDNVDKDGYRKVPREGYDSFYKTI